MLLPILETNLLQTADFNRVYQEASLLQKSLQIPLTVNPVSVTSSQQVLTVNSTSDTIDPNNGKLTLREAIDLANRTPGTQTINFDLGAGVKTIALTGGQLSIQDSLIINGTGNLTIDANKRSRIFDISRDVSVTLSKLSLINGSTLTGGGAISNGGTLNLIDVTLSGNYSPLGGALGNVGNVYLANVTLNNNRAAQGGGIYNAGYLNISNSTFSGNSAVTDGGGLYSDRGSVEIQSSTFTLNLADSNNNGSGYEGNGNGGGIYVKSGMLTIQNTIVANNFDTPNNNGSGVRYVDVLGSFTDLGNNLIGDGTGSTGWAVRSRVGTNTGRIDPKLAPLRNNGGFTQTHALLLDSPAVNAGNIAMAPMTDQRGIRRTVADTGAYEALPNLTVDSLVDGNDGNLTAGDVSLREALQYITDGGTINFASNLRGTITLELGELLIDRSLTIKGSGAKGLSVSGNNHSRVFVITSNNTVDLSGLTIAYGRGSSEAYGAGIYNAGNLTISDSMIRDNTSGRFGAAIFNQKDATLNLYRSTIFNNRSVEDDEKYPQFSGTAIYNEGTATIQNSTLSNNSGSGSIINGGVLSINASTITSSNRGLWNIGTVRLKNTIWNGWLFY